MSGSVTINLTESSVLAALRTFLLDATNNAIEVVQGQGNRVPEPEGANFVIMTPLWRERLATNIDSYAYVGQPAPGVNSSLAKTDYVVQLDFHGPLSGDYCQVASTLFRDDYCVQVFNSASIMAAPLYMSDPRQVPFIDGEQQYENRWIVEAHIDIEPTVAVPLASWATAEPVGLIEVDVTYPG